MAVDDFGGKVGGKKIEIVKGSSDALAGQRGARRAQARRTGRREGRGRPALRRRRPRGQGLRQDQAGRDLRQRHVGGAGHDAARSGAELLPLLDRRRAVDGRPRRPTPINDEEATRKWRPSPRTIPSPTRRCSASWREFCKAGGHVRVEVLGADRQQGFRLGHRRDAGQTSTRSTSRSAAPTAVNFLTQYQQAGGQAPLIGGSITVDQTVLGSKGKTHDVVIGTPSAGPIADDNDTPAWKKFVAAYKKHAGRLPVAVAVRPRLLRRHEALLIGLQQGQRRRLRRRRQAARRRWRASLSIRRPARSRSTRTATPSPTCS